MNRFIVRILTWVLPVLLLSVPADLFLSNQLKKSNCYAHDEYSVWNDLYDGTINSEIVVYGSSRAWVHIDPQILGDSLGHSVYNLGIDGHNFWLQYLRHRLLLENNPAPEFILFSLDLFTLQKNKELYNADQFLPYLLWNTEMKNYVEDYEGYSFYDYYIPLVRYYGKRKAVKNAIINSFVPVNPDSGRHNGYKEMDEKWNEDFATASKKMNYYEVQIDTQSMDLFEKFLRECKEKSIKLVFVYTPEYIEGQKFVANRKEIIDIYDNYAKKYGILFLDYSSDEMCRQKEYFYNASHLNKDGAKLFTRKLSADLVRTNPEFEMLTKGLNATN